jgi:hypothetical protein
MKVRERKKKLHNLMKFGYNEFTSSESIITTVDYADSLK